MRRLRRVLRLAVAVNARSKLKFVLLTALVTIGALVFLGVAELSRASSADLSEAIEADLGAAGTYRITPSPDLGLTGEELLVRMRAALEPLTDQPLRVARKLPSVDPECPPYDEMGEVTPVVLLDEVGRVTPLRPGGALGSASDLCLAGLVVPHEALREATPYEKANFGASIVLGPAYERSVQLTATAPASYVVVVTTGGLTDESAEIRAAVTESLAVAAAVASVPEDLAVVVVRGDTGTSVRTASEGIALVYGLIGWGVLLVSGLGLLIAELVVLRDRTWYFGLARAVGARKGDVAWMVLADIVLVLLAGFALAILLATVAAPAVSSLGRTAFQTDLVILRLEALPKLFAGSLLVLLLGGAYPAWRATRLDPLDVLERR